MPTINEQILDAQLRHSIYLERYKTGVLRDILALLDKSNDDLAELIAARLVKIEQRGYTLSAAETKRLQRLLGDLTIKRAQVYAVIEAQLSGELVDFSQYEADFQVRLHENVGVTLSGVPANAQLKAIVTTQPFEGRLLKAWVRNNQMADLNRIQDAINIGITQNQTIEQIVRRLRGTKAASYTDGTLNASKRDVTAVVRTAVAHVQSRAKAEVYQANADIIRAWQQISTLDSRTSPVCIRDDHRIYRQYADVIWTPRHWNCRSIVIAYFADDEHGNRASQFGPVPGSTDYDTFLRRQSKEFQNDVLGIKRARLYRESGKPVKKFIDETGQFYTLAQLKAKDLT
ncbi:phage head morphogenesis protein [Hymenobacter sp. HSC-4F20]|uniref:phage minor head protein n=1 Tax=Hymenobacter sp. HSC-4F20 TaxID=2864135 RepID=UPI001C732EC8|nr:phage minor head protein [Hymenobacter sp. HSC-4F20]MBX0289715.1 phage head morphogenesis protein [Hymenobacter sp. HSC-4F20]